MNCSGVMGTATMTSEVMMSLKLSISRSFFLFFFLFFAYGVFWLLRIEIEIGFAQMTRKVEAKH